MLKCVVFALTEYGFEYLSKKRRSIESALYKIETVFLMYQGNKDDIGKNETFQNVEQACKNCLKEEILIITDIPSALKYFLEEEFFAIALSHNRNKDISFKEALYVVEDVGQLDFKAYDEVYRRLAGIPWDILKTEHLAVRESTVADVEDFYRIYKEPSVTYYMEDLFQNPDEENAYMESYIKQIYGFYGFGMWTVLLKSTGEVIGRAGLNVREGYELPELGFVIDVPHQGMGYGFEVCSAILAYAKEELFFEEVQALVREENEASLRLLDKLGFLYEKNVVENGQEYRLMIRKL